MTVELLCPYGHGQYGEHAVTPPYGWPCTGIDTSGRPHSHHIELIDWLRWLTAKVEGEYDE